MFSKSSKRILFTLIGWLAFGLPNTAAAEKFYLFQQAQQEQNDTTKKDSLRFPIQDRRGDPYSSYRNNPFDLLDTSVVKRNVLYDPKTGEYYVEERIGSRLYRKPVSFSREEFLELSARQQEIENFQRRANANFNLNRRLVRPKLRIYDDLFNRVFGNGKVIIQPQGNVDLTMGYQGQNVENPTLPERARKYGTLDFDMNAQFNMNANIGDKMKLPINFNTLANFNFENQLKLDYKGKGDEILKSIEAGNTSFATRGTLIQGAQSLFGLKTQLQFGRMYVTTVLANMQSQRQTNNYRGGAAVNSFNKKLDDYEENRHFLLAQYFRNNYNRTMSTLPFVQSKVQIMRLEVWVTNRIGQTTDSRPVTAFMDLGEREPYNNAIPRIAGDSLPSNNANGLYGIINNEAFRNPNNVSSLLMAAGLKPVQDFERTYARKLDEGIDFIFNRQAGFISINQYLAADEVLGVAFQYTYNGRVYQVGEFAQDVSLDSTKGVQKMLFLKMLKATSQRTNLPLWDLMMKNVYSLDMYNIQREGFKINLLYEEPSGGEKRILPEGDDPGRPLLRILRLDRLNDRNDPTPDGVFDFVDSFTVQPLQGRIIFPVLEPFGEDLRRLGFASQPQDVWSKYVFTALYDTIKAIAQQNYPSQNRFWLRGEAKATNTDEIYLNAINVPPGSVKVTAGGQLLREGMDYVIDYSLGKLTILNQAIKNSGIPVNVSLENNTGFGLQNRGFFATRLDYIVNQNLSLGATMMRLGERPFFTKTNYGDDPIRNRMYGLDFNYQNEIPRVNRWLEKLPFYSPEGRSSIQAYGEAAYFKPGHAPQIGRKNEGLVYLDDFEGTRSNIDLRFPFIGWAHASTPAGAGFSEADLVNDLAYNQNRARLAWYQIEPVLQDSRNPNNPINDRELTSDPRVRQVSNQELFPQRSNIPGTNQLITFDLTFYPKERGSYNYDTRGQFLNPNGTFNNPKNRWGGIMRAIDQTDFETANIEFLEFWVQDPFMSTDKYPNGYTPKSGGKLFINFGNVSEDILKDGRRFYENGLPTPSQPNMAVDETSIYGKTPIVPIQITNGFSNDPNDRVYQDVGFDGMNDDEEIAKRRQDFLTPLQAILGNSAAMQKLLQDPSGDNFVNYRSETHGSGTGILERYKYYNNNQGNSPVNPEQNLVVASTLYPDNEDLNRDNTLNESEEYFEYEIDVTPMGLQIGENYITDKRLVSVKYENGTSGTETWYQFRIPVAEYTRKVGDIPDFKSIRFMRMYMTGWEDSVTLRFARLDLIRNNWRQFGFEITRDGMQTPTTGNSISTLNTLAVNIEENDRREPVPYKTPPGIERVQQIANGGINILQNEQSLSLQARNLIPGTTRGVFKTFNNDLRMYRKLNMFIHAEELVPSDVAYTPLANNAVQAVVRIGQDILTNYYEIRIPLHITRPAGQTIVLDSIWPEVNSLDFAMQELIDLKDRRNQSPGWSPTIYYSEQMDGRTYGIFGNPNLAEVRTIFIGVENPEESGVSRMSTEIWVNELRLSNINENGSWAAIGRVDVQLADLGMISVSAGHRTTGFGAIEQRIQERARETTSKFDASMQIDAGKLMPRNFGVSVPLYASLSKMYITPEYDPYDKDVLLRRRLRNCDNCDSIRNVAQEQHTIQTLNLSNVRLLPRPDKPLRFYSPSNFDLTYNYLRQRMSSPIVTEDLIRRHHVGVGYAFAQQPKYWEPLKNKLKSNSPWITWLKDFNINYRPNSVAVKYDFDRQFGRYVPRIVNTWDNKVERVDSSYDKYFNFDRLYTARWDLTRSFNIDFNAINRARVDEPFGELTPLVRDTIMRNLLQGGRNTTYDQKIIFTYNVPTQKLPFLDFTNIQASYTALYRWSASSLLMRVLNQGNILENGNIRQLNAEVDFGRLYAKSRWLASLEQEPVRQQTPRAQANPQNRAQADSAKTKRPNRDRRGLFNRRSGIAPVMDSLATDSIPTKQQLREARKKKRIARREVRRKEAELRRQERQSRTYEIGGVARTAGKMLTMVKRASINVSENYMSRLPGYTDSTRFLGQNFKTKAPGFGYILGMQPDTAMLNRFSAKGLVTRDPEFNQLFMQNFDQRISMQAQLEPFRDMMIDINYDKTFSKSYSELFKDTLGTGNHLHLTPYNTGSFNITYIAFQTLFTKFNPNETSEMFQKFQEYRRDMSLRLGKGNPYWVNGGSPVQNDGYAEGYDRYAQQVLIPSFIAAYTKKDPNAVGLIKNSNPRINSNPFSAYKAMPNWRVNFNGLTRIPALEEIFTSINISHAYQGRLSMNSFASALMFNDPFLFGQPAFKDSTSGNYVPYFLVPNLTIVEGFEPLIGIDITTVSQINGRFEYRKSRQLSLSMLDYQLSEVNSTEMMFSGAYRTRGMQLPFRLPRFLNRSGDSKLENDLTFRMEFSLRDDATANSTLDQNSTFSTAGQKVVRINPSIDYIINNRVNIRLYFDRQKAIPYISTSAPTTNTRAGVQMRISLAQ